MNDNEAEAITREDIAATQQIKDAFASYFAGNSLAAVPYVKPYSRTACKVELQTVAESIEYQVCDGQPLAALAALLQGRGTVEALQNALVDDYLAKNAADIAQERAMSEPVSVPRFLREAL